MSDPTYRIEREHTPGEAFAWYVRVFALTDDAFPVHTLYDDDGEFAIRRAQTWIAAQSGKQPTVSLFVDDDGQRVEAHSVKAS